MYAVELMEGKDVPAQRQVYPEEKKIGKTACLLLQLTKALYIPLASLLSLTVVFVFYRLSLCYERREYSLEH